MESLLKVKIVRTKQGASLVEYINEKGVPERKIVPSFTIVNDGGVSKVDKDTFNMGIPYGLPLEDIITDVTIRAKDLIDNLHSTGLWTYEDFLANPNGIISSIMATSGTNLQSIFRAIKAHQKGEYNG